MSKPLEVYGFPLVSAENIYRMIRELFKIRQWRSTKGPYPLEDYTAMKIPDEDREAIKKFAPKREVEVFRNPVGGTRFLALRTKDRPWFTAQAFFPNEEKPEDPLTIITCEWKHGTKQVALVPPSGVPTKDEMGTADPWASAAMRLFPAETGIILEKVIRLTHPMEGVSDEGMVGASLRQHSDGVHIFLAVPKMPIRREEELIDTRQILKAVMIPISEWGKMLEEGRVYDGASYVANTIALTAYRTMDAEGKLLFPGAPQD